MRGAPFAIVLALLAVSFAPTSGAAAGDFLEDPSGDVKLEVGGNAQPTAGNAFADSADLTAFAILETDETFIMSVTTLGPPEQAGPQVRVAFDWNGATYFLEFTSYVNGISAMGAGSGEVVAYACLLQERASGTEYVDCYGATLDATTNTIVTEVPKVHILDRRNIMPTKGTTLADIRVTSEITIMNINGDSLFRFSDVMPDGDATGSYTLVMGDAASGHITLTSDERVRVSNGGATTFVYKVEVHNARDVSDEADLAFADMPADWKGTVQSPVRIPAKGSATVAVLVSVPFAHEHGGYSGFNLTAKSRSDATSEARIRMGVLHTPIPQPAGHHPDLYLHAQREEFFPFTTLFPWSWGYMNTEAPTDTDAPEMSSNGYSDGAIMWYVALNPGLQMGLDFDPDGIGTLEASIIGRTLGEGTVSADLVLVEDGEYWNDGVILAESDAATVAFDLTNPTPFTLTLLPTLDADYIAHKMDQNIVLRIRMEAGSIAPGFFIFGGGQTGPSLVSSGFKLSLPLNEYHDRLSGEAEAASQISLEAVGPVEKAARPGATVTYAFRLQAPSGDYELEVAGGDASLGALAPSGAIQHDGGSARDVTLAVQLPAEATSGEELEVLVYVYDKADPTRMAIARTKTTVSTGDDAVPDESQVFAAAQEAAKDTPAPGVLAFLAAVGASLGLVRRR